MRLSSLQLTKTLMADGQFGRKSRKNCLYSLRICIKIYWKVVVKCHYVKSSLEYILAFIITASFYGHLNFPWLYFIVFLLLPDITMVGYLINTKIGALFYNMGHSFVLPAMLMVIGFNDYINTSDGRLIWLAHIFLDRALGYGLKYDDAFRRHIYSRLRNEEESMASHLTLRFLVEMG